MKTFETSTKVEDRGEVRVLGVPFAQGTEVEVTISPKRKSADEFAAAWARLCIEMRGRSKGISQEEICEEIERHRTGR